MYSTQETGIMFWFWTFIHVIDIYEWFYQFTLNIESPTYVQYRATERGRD